MNERVTLRRLPHPYRALLAICSDLDETPSARVYAETMRFMNTTQTTAMGPGVGLEVGNSIYFDMPAEQFAYWNTDDAGQAMVRAMIRSGHIDVLHSYGDHATTRARAGAALDELARHDCRLQVWVDHGTAITNFDPDIMGGAGDLPGHTAYHADLTIGQGVRFIWTGRVTSVIGQDVPASLRGIFRLAHPLASAKTVAKEAAKRRLARHGNEKYSIHLPNRALRPARLRDGAEVTEFLRCNPHFGGVSCCETAKGIGQVLTDKMLRRLIDRQGACVLYTHLGKVLDPAVPLQADAVAGFRRLAEKQRAGELLVTTTRRALGYLSVRDDVTWSANAEGERPIIDVQTNGATEADLAGLTFHVDRPERWSVRVDGRAIENVTVNPPDHTARASVSLPWRRLEFPEF